VACYDLQTNAKIFVRHALMIKTAVHELYFAKQFCSGNYNKIFFMLVLPCKKVHFSLIVAAKIFVIMLLQKTKNLCICVCKKN